MTTVNPDKLAFLLRFHPDCTGVDYLVNGFRYGFSLKCHAPLRNHDAVNLKSARDRPDVLMEKVNKEVKLGHFAGPFKTRPFPYLFTNPLALVRKANNPNKWRLITDMSVPRNLSINSFIKQEDATLQYRSFDEALKLVRDQGPGAFMAKSDLDSAFRRIPMDHHSLPYLGMLVNGLYYYNRNLSFGAKSSCAVFEKVSTAIEWCAQGREKIPLHII